MQKIYKQFVRFSWVLIIVIIAPILIKRNVPDTDTFFLAATGRWIAEHMSVPIINPFVIHDGFSVIIQQWGFDVLMYYIYEYGGSTGLFIYTLIAYGMTVLLMYAFFKLFTKNHTTQAIITLIASFGFLCFASPRPTSLTIIIMLLFLYSLEKWHQTASLQWLIPLPILSFIQVNMHSSMWPMLFVFIIPYIFPHAIVKKNHISKSVAEWFRRNKWLLVTIIIMFATGLLNPNGLNGMLYVFKSYGHVSSNDTSFIINELAQPTMMDTMGIFVIISIIFITVFITKNAKRLMEYTPKQHSDIIRLYTAAGTTVLAAMHLRNMWYLLIGALPLIAVILDGIPSFPFNRHNPSGIKCAGQMSAALLAVLLSFNICSSMPYTIDENQDTEFTPISAVEYLHTKEDVILFNEFNSGAFLEWKGYQVYIDARPELFAKNINGKDDVLKEYISVCNGYIDYEQFLNQYHFTHLIVSTPFLRTYLSKHHDYHAVVVSNQYVMYEYAPS